MFGALTGAIAWNLITWWYGIPSSSSHALIGGLCGAAVAKAGTWSLVPAGILKTVAFIFISPLVGMALGAALMLAVAWIFVRTTPSRVDRWFRRMQLVSASLYSLGHGGNDAQKTAGIIWMLLIASGYLAASAPIPAWVLISCYVTIALGTAFGGWRIVKTMGQRITKLRPVGGFCAETGGAAMLFIATAPGHPGVHHAHHHGRDRRRRRRAERVRGALGHRGRPALGVGPDDSVFGVPGGGRLGAGARLAAYAQLVVRAARALLLHLELDLELARALEAQPQGEALALLERPHDVDQHQVRAAGAQLVALARRDLEGFHLRASSSLRRPAA